MGAKQPFCQFFNKGDKKTTWSKLSLVMVQSIRPLDTPKNSGVFSGAALARKFGVFWRVHSTLQLIFWSGAAPENTPDNTPK